MDQWLVRTAQNLVAGPYTKEQVCQLVLQGQLSQDDDICPANGYWIPLHDRDDVFKHLGIHVPSLPGDPDEEITETQSMTGTIRVDPEAGPDSTQEHEDDSFLPELADFSTEDTGVFSVEMLKERRVRSDLLLCSPAVSEGGLPESIASPPSADLERARQRPKILVLSSIEKPSIWRGFAWVLILVGAVIAYAVVRLLRV